MANRQSNKDEVVRLLIQAKPSNFMIEIPAHWKVTVSQGVNPQGRSFGGEGYCMRVYEGEKLRAVYTGVMGFRDLSIPMAKEYRKETGASSWERDSEGNFKNSTEGHVERQFLLEAGEYDSNAPSTPF